MDLVILSGKGGTGKTTIAAAISELAKDVVRVDCDVDASNLYLYYPGKDIYREDFFGGKVAIIDNERCTRCGKCERVCRFDAIENFTIDEIACEGCGACVLVCPEDAILLKDEKAADAMITKLEDGILSRADMGIGSDGSGLLITRLRENAIEHGQKQKDIKRDKLTIIDASPGIGCPVIASVTGSDAVLAVTEPTQSGLLDLKRVVELSRQFDIDPMVCINKFDINENMSNKILEFAQTENLKLVGKIPYDETIMESIYNLKPITYYKGSKAAKAIETMWRNIENIIF
ncbi:MAG: 4Fe-4S binding protein [Clostridiales bacterium]|nr:4Fe-4S binding protein [Clostridiales bacterium]